MSSSLSLRSRMMLLFCAVVAVLLAGSYAGFYALLSREVRAQLDQQLLNAARPVIADLISDPTERDVDDLNVPDEYFELLEPSGRITQQSKNLKGRPLAIEASRLDTSRTVFLTLKDDPYGRLRLGLVPFQRQGRAMILAVAVPTRQARSVLTGFRRAALFLLPLCLLLTAGISAWYVGRSLQPVAHLTRHAAQMTERLRDAASGEVWAPLPVRNPRDELGQLADTFNRLFARVDAALCQLRQFVTDASHELRTPLAVLRGETELLLAESRPAEEYQRTLRVIHDELKKLSRIVDGLFTLAMADAGELRLARDPLYLNEVLEETCCLASPRAQAKGIAIERDLKQEVAYLGDEAFLRQLFLTFLDNAIKYSPPHTRVRVGIEKSNGVARVRFEDQGHGIGAEHLPRIFERFYRAPESSESSSAGAEPQSGGLGLAIAEAIARAQGGWIDCTSLPGKGSTFTVVLPLPPPVPDPA